MSERRIDIGGRDVTDFPGLWSDEDKVIPAKPEAMEIETERGLVTLQVHEPPSTVWISQNLGEFPEDVRLDTTEQIRQLIAWLQQVAEWREAQESK